VARWQTRARVGVGAFGVGCAAVVYLALGDRPRSVTPPAVERIDPKAN
jgi:hypothetical protein